MSKFANSVYYILIPIVFILVGWFARVAWTLPKAENPIAQIKTYPLEKYTIENLSAKFQVIEPSQIVIGKELQKSKSAPNGGANFTSYEFTYSFDPTLSGGLKKTVSGLINVPKGTGPFPVVVMFRGFIDQKQYFIGDGTLASGEYFASNGFITIAPDFFGYGDSDAETSDIFESRFQTYTTAMALLKSVKNIEKWDGKNVFIWGHSNGGQIALTVLEASGANYPTVLWAPNTAKFPYSILYYLDEADDQGKFLITKLADFMANYDVTKYAFNNYLSQIKSPIELDQGTGDDTVPVKWNEDLVQTLKKDAFDITFVKYPGADHNLQPGWNQVVANDLKFFKDHLEK